MKLKSHQIKALSKGKGQEFFAYLMGRGTGKTKVVLEDASYLYKQNKIDLLLTIAPNEVHVRWVTEQIPLHLYVEYDAIVWRQRVFEFKHSKPCLKVATFNIEAFQTTRGTIAARNLIKKYPKSMVVVDESTRIKTPGAKRTRNILWFPRNVPYRRIMTGNEVTNTPFDLYSQFKFLSYDFWKQNFRSFKMRYGEWTSGYKRITKTKNTMICPHCKMKTSLNVIKTHLTILFKCPNCKERIRNGPSMLKKEARAIIKSKALFEYPVLKNYKNMPELRSRIEPYSFRVRKKDCLDLPEKIYMPIYAELNKKQQQVYRDIKNNLIATYKNETLTINHKLSLFLRFQQIVGGFFPTDEGDLVYLGSPKLDVLLYDLEDVDSDAIIIWAVFVEELKLLDKHLKKLGPTGLLYGGVPKTKRQNIISDFQDGKIRFLIANPDVGGTGLNLQRSNLHYYYSNSWKPEPRWQSEDRSHRIGQHWPVVYKDIFIKKTVDDKIQKMIERKKSIAEFFKDNSIKDII